MAEIRTQRRKGRHTWLWVVLAVLAIIAAVLLLGWLGYIDLPGVTTAADTLPAADRGLAAAHTSLIAEG